MRRVLGVGLALLPAAAMALSLELKPSVHVEVGHDDNIFRAPSEPAWRSRRVPPPQSMRSLLSPARRPPTGRAFAA